MWTIVLKKYGVNESVQYFQGDSAIGDAPDITVISILLGSKDVSIWVI